MANLLQEFVGLFVKRKADPFYFLVWNDETGPVFLDMIDGGKACVIGEDPDDLTRYLSDPDADDHFGPSVGLGMAAVDSVLKQAIRDSNLTLVQYVTKGKRGRIAVNTYPVGMVQEYVQDLLDRGYR